jgi:hypothetical protein
MTNLLNNYPFFSNQIKKVHFEKKIKIKIENVHFSYQMKFVSLNMLFLNLNMPNI